MAEEQDKSWSAIVLTYEGEWRRIDFGMRENVVAAVKLLLDDPDTQRIEIHVVEEE